MPAAAETPFRLSAQFLAHDMDARAVYALDDNTVVSASRDHLVKVWKRTVPADASGSAREFELARTLAGHSHYVNCIGYLANSSVQTAAGATSSSSSSTAETSQRAYPAGWLVTGGMDKLILMWDMAAAMSDEPAFTLVGHEDSVCAVNCNSTSGQIISASWDKTARVWRNGQCELVLRGHEYAVWAVLCLPNVTNRFITASADRTIKFWTGEKCTKTVSGHSDVVRGLVNLPHLNAFVSCSNDSSLRIWNMEGDCLSELYGHTSFIYALSLLPATNELVSSGEDKSLRVWRDGQCVQTVLIPSQSIWSNCTLPNGDIVAASNDGFLRIFTRHESLVASADNLKAYDDAVAQITLQAKTVGSVDKEKLAGPERLASPGAKDQEVVMIKNLSGLVEAHQWSAATEKWTKLGEVVDAVGSGRKQLLDGIEYDHVFDVDIAEGRPPLKLPYNVSENRDAAAQKFITANELPQSYLDQVAAFITQNTTGATLGQAAGGGVDPYTGAGSYVPGGGSDTTSTSSGAVNPDPYTGANRSSSVPAAGKIVPLPETGYVKFNQCNLAAVFKKLCEFNAGQAEDAKLTEQELNAVENTCNFLQAPSAASMRFSPGGFVALIKTLRTWPMAQRFPSLDILRILVLHVPLTQSMMAAEDDSFVHMVVRLSGISGKEVAPDAAVMLALRLLSNLFATDSNRALVMADRQLILSAIAGVLQGRSNKNLSLAYITLLLNFALATVWVVKEQELASGLLTGCLEFASDETACADAECEYRCAVAAGHLMFKYGALKQQAAAQGLGRLVERLQTRHGQSQLLAIAAELKQLQAK